MKKLSREMRSVIKDAAERLTGFRRRAYQARITRKYFDGSSREAERRMGWGGDVLRRD